jgi:hypothetical protein
MPSKWALSGRPEPAPATDETLADRPPCHPCIGEGTTMPTRNPVLVHVRVDGPDLRAALGSHHQPVTLVFTSYTLTALTPTATTRIPATALAKPWPGIHQAGLGPRDADLLRDAAAAVTVADLALTTTTVTLTTESTTLTVHRR